MRWSSLNWKSLLILLAAWTVCLVFLTLHCYWGASVLGTVSMQRPFETGDSWPGSGGSAGSPGYLPWWVLPGDYLDAYEWIRYAQYMVEHGEWRMRRSPFENVPYGREVHWHSGLMWWLVALGTADHRITGIPVKSGIERMALFANPLLLALFVIGFSSVIARRFGAWAGALLGVGMIGAHPFVATFAVGYTDHHGLISTAALATIIFLLAGGIGWLGQARTVPRGSRPLMAPCNESTARRWFVASAVAGAMGLWISVASQTIVLIAVGLGVLASTAFYGKGAPREGSAHRPTHPRWWHRPGAWASLVFRALCFGKAAPAESVTYLPELWRWWGGAGALVSLFFYALEYFPNHMGMRLEVNHPLYALAWWGGGELLCQITRWLVQKRRPTGRRSWALVVLAVLAVSALPAAVCVGGYGWFCLNDRFFWGLHERIKEFVPVSQWVRMLPPGSHLTVISAVFSIFPLFIPLAVVLLFWRALSSVQRSMLRFALVPGLIFLCFFLFQVRWMQPWSATLLVLMVLCVVVLLDIWRRQRRVYWIWGFLCLVFAGEILLFPRLDLAIKWRAFTTSKVDSEFAEYVVIRDVAQLIRRMSGSKDAVILSNPSDTLPLIYFGQFRGVGTLYWENLQGLKDAAAMYGADTEDEARRLIEQRGVTHVVTVSKRNFIEEYYRLAHHGEGTEEGLKNCFAYKLYVTAQLPVWLRPVPYVLPPGWAAMVPGVCVFEVALDQTVPECFLHLGDYHAGAGKLDLAITNWQEALRLQPDLVEVVPRLWRALSANGLTTQAETMLSDAIRRTPPHRLAKLHFELAEALVSVGAIDRAITHYRTSLASDPRAPSALNNLAWILATHWNRNFRSGSEAVDLAQRACQQTSYANPAYLDTLAAAYAEAGRFAEAVASAQQAIDLMQKAGNTSSAERVKDRLKLYQARQPYRQ